MVGGGWDFLPDLSYQISRDPCQTEEKGGRSWWERERVHKEEGGAGSTSRRSSLARLRRAEMVDGRLAGSQKRGEKWETATETSPILSLGFRLPCSPFYNDETTPPRTNPNPGRRRQ